MLAAIARQGFDLRQDKACEVLTWIKVSAAALRELRGDETLGWLSNRSQTRGIGEGTYDARLL